MNKIIIKEVNKSQINLTESKYITVCNGTYNIFIDNLPMWEIDKIPTYDCACKLVSQLNQFRLDVKDCYKAYGLGWITKSPIVILVIDDDCSIVYEYDKRNHNIIRVEYDSFISAYRNIVERDDCGLPIIQRWLAVNYNLSTNKKCYSITDFLLKR